jgi:hypothetical protein
MGEVSLQMGVRDYAVEAIRWVESFEALTMLLVRAGMKILFSSSSFLRKGVSNNFEALSRARKQHGQRFGVPL